MDVSIAMPMHLKRDEVSTSRQERDAGARFFIQLRIVVAFDCLFINSD